MSTEAPVLAAHHWATNADLIADVARLGYLRRPWRTLDPTYGRGLWWTRFRPDNLTAHDQAIDGTDFRDLDYPDGHFEAIAYDPPYVSVGGRRTTGMKDMHTRYGLTDAPTSPAELQALINAGLAEMGRLLAPRGFLLVKCQDYISSGKLWPGTYYTTQFAWSLGLTLVDRFEHYSTSPRPQPAGRRQVHARRNLSTLLVWQRGRS